MKDKLTRKGTKCVACLLLFGSLAYSAVVLTTEPAYAASVCEPDDCAIVVQHVAPILCKSDGGVQEVLCGSDSNYYQVFCNDGYIPPSGNCTNW
jgi:hypothetical protein